MADAPPDARAVTLLPHWAHAVAWCWKRIENRQRPIPPALVGQRVAIHAGATLPRGWEDDVDRWPGAPYVVQRGPAGAVIVDVCVDARPIITRAIVATAVLRPHDPSASDWRFAGRGHLIADWRTSLPAWADAHASHWWALHDVITLAEPVAVRRGQLGLWRLDAATVEAVGAAGGWG